MGIHDTGSAHTMGPSAHERATSLKRSNILENPQISRASLPERHLHVSCQLVSFQNSVA